MITSEYIDQLGMGFHLTQRANLKETRFGWLRLTPAYSVNLVSEILDHHEESHPILLDPFCGTGTTALVAAERGIECDTTDINPFLIWLTKVKTDIYSDDDLISFQYLSTEILSFLQVSTTVDEWYPPLHQIDKWWDDDTLKILSRTMGAIKHLSKNSSIQVSNLLKIAFCRVMISLANVSFGHQSMSFRNKEKPIQLELLQQSRHDIFRDNWYYAVESIARSAKKTITSTPEIILADARNFSSILPNNHYTCVITSPPYPNRMSYIRELRPYMYWLGFLANGKDAGELDWQAIGGTWGCATSKTANWKPTLNVTVPFEGFNSIINRINEKSPVLARYVHKYFYDMAIHSEELYMVIKPGGVINYIVGNSKFYDVMLPVEHIFCAIFEQTGFANVSIKTIRKRSSKKELFEFIVTAKKP